VQPTSNEGTNDKPKTSDDSTEDVTKTRLRRGVFGGMAQVFKGLKKSGLWY
jgi:hypothetical protein